MYRRIIIIATLLISIFCLSNSFKIYDFKDTKKIKIEIKGNVLQEKTIEVPIGTTFNDIVDQIGLKEDSDISCLSNLEVLKNNQILNIPKKNNSNLISINTASIYELSSLPGIGKSTAIKIIDYRNEYGCFIKLDEIMNISGIGMKKYERIKKYICL